MTPESVVELFRPNSLELARLTAGLLKKELADLVGKTPGAISQYEHGYAKPTAETLVLLAEKLGYPIEFFCEDARRPSSGSTHFRSLRSSSQRERDQALARAGLLTIVANYLEQRVTLPEAKIPAFPTEADADQRSIEDVAHEVRQAWGLTRGPVANVVHLLESKGVLVGRLALDSGRVDAFSFDGAQRPVVILGNDKGDKARSRMDAAHELGHLVMHHDAEPGDSVAEQQANAFAAAFLMPSTDIRDELPNRIDFTALLDLKRVWGVSMQALLFRSRRLDVLSPSTYKRAMTKVSMNGWRTKEPGDLGPPEQPQLLARAVALLRERRQVRIEEIADAVHLPPEIVHELVDARDDRLDFVY